MRIKNRAAKSVQQDNKPYKFKPCIFPDDFHLIVDTQEKKPLFTRTPGLTLTRKTLKDGDYSIKGFENCFFIERKMTSDFYTYIGVERSKTIKKVERMSQAIQDHDGFAALVIEADIYELFSLQYYTEMTPEHAAGFITSLNLKCNIHTFISNDRKLLEKWILDRAIKFYKLKRGLTK